MTKELNFSEMENLQGGIYDPINDLQSGLHSASCSILIAAYNIAAKNHLVTTETLNEMMTQAAMAGC